MKLFLIYICFTVFTLRVLCKRNIPRNISLGVGTSAYQIEGAWNISDRGESVWDNFIHNNKKGVKDGSTADVACDSYHQYERDIEMLKELGVDHYRFSISWSRILPNGFINKTNPSGIEYYNKLIDKLLENNIQPVATLFHWDYPTAFQNLGGWTNSDNIQYFVEFSDLMFHLYGDRVKYWTTFNEPSIFCMKSSGVITHIVPPSEHIPGISEYMCGHNILKAHAAVYHLYRKKYKPKYKGQVTITLLGIWCEPASDSNQDKLAADICLQFMFGWIGHPILSREGDYPKLVKQMVDERSKAQGFSISRLPKFTDKEISEIKGSVDYLGINHYTTELARLNPIKNISDLTVYGDMGVKFDFDYSWPRSRKNTQFTVPWGFSKLLLWIKDNYDNPEVFVFENGYSDNGELDDDDRIYYIASYLNAILDAVEHGCKIIGYTVWALMDNFEWNRGYALKFGLYHVDFENPMRLRTPKRSAHFYMDIIEKRKIAWM